MTDPARDERFEARLAALLSVRAALLPALMLAQESEGFVSNRAIERIAAHLRLTANEVDGVATAYPEVRREPPGERVIRVCTGVGCRQGEAILAALEAGPGLAQGDGAGEGVRIEETACCFACGVAPVVDVDGVLIGRVADATAVLDGTKRGQARPGEERADAEADSEPAGGPAAADPSARVEDLASEARARRASGPARLLVGAGECGLAVGAGEVFAALRAEAARRGSAVPIVAAGCTGRCHAAVEVTLQRPGSADITWSQVRPEQAPALLAIAERDVPVGSLPGGFFWEEGGLPTFLAGQHRILLASLGRVDPASAGEAAARGRYRGFARALAGPPEAVIAEVKRANLAGRGGAYFPAAVKWEGARSSGAAPRYLVVNAEEGEPGVFKDRHLLEGDPHLVIEGMLIAAYAIGAEQIIVYLNGLAELARERLERAFARARQHGLLGEHILGSAFSCDVEVRRGAGGYVLGEESAMLESIEGRRPMPRVRPPFPTVAGLWGRPTVINNVETIACAALILEHGADWFKGLGNGAWTGTKIIALSGDVERPGLVEVEMGTPLRVVIEDLAGGVAGGRGLQAVLTGGPSGVLASPEMLDTPLEPRRDDVLLGSGNLAVLDEDRSLVATVQRLTRFNAEESCGKCTPCREGVNRMREILDRVAAGKGRPTDRQDLLDLSEIAASASICGLGQMAPNPVRSALRHFGLPGLEGVREEASHGAERHR